MKILLAPSESKNEGGEQKFKLENLSFYNELGGLRSELWAKYLGVFACGDPAAICALTGLKNPQNVDFDLAMSAIERYSGVAYDYLDFSSLHKKALNFLDENLLIFSNLFGIVKPNDLLPNYKLKQGAKCAGIDTAKFYQKKLSEFLDEYLAGDEILDIRAEFYNKFYTPKHKYFTLKFFKNDKVVSHFAKAYRGRILRYLAQNCCSSFDEFLALKIPELKLLDIEKIKNKITYNFEIISQN